MPVTTDLEGCPEEKRAKKTPRFVFLGQPQLGEISARLHGLAMAVTETAPWSD